MLAQIKNNLGLEHRLQSFLRRGSGSSGACCAPGRFLLPLDVEDTERRDVLGHSQIMLADQVVDLFLCRCGLELDNEAIAFDYQGWSIACRRTSLREHNWRLPGRCFRRWSGRDVKHCSFVRND